MNVKAAKASGDLASDVSSMHTHTHTHTRRHTHSHALQTHVHTQTCTNMHEDTSAHTHTHTIKGTQTSIDIFLDNNAYKTLISSLMASNTV